MKTFVYIDHFKGEALPASWEAIGVGKTLGDVTALVFGSDVEALAKSVRIHVEELAKTSAD